MRDWMIREVAYLVKREGLTFPEVAKRLGVTTEQATRYVADSRSRRRHPFYWRQLSTDQKTEVITHFGRLKDLRD